MEHDRLINIGNEIHGPEDLKNYKLVYVKLEDEPAKLGAVEQQAKPRRFTVTRMT